MAELVDSRRWQRKREKFTEFCPAIYPKFEIAPHLKLLSESLEAIERGDIDRLIVTMPPRHGKTWAASHLFPAWFLGRNPDKYVIAATYAQDYADDIGRSVRNIMADPNFTDIFPECRLSADSQSTRRFATQAGGQYFAVGAGGPITGRGADLLLIDDPIKGREDADSEAMQRHLRDWYTSVAYTRLMPKGRVVLIQTRWRASDLAGWVQTEHAHENWETVDFPAILPSGQPLWGDRYPLETLERIRSTLPFRDWSALYMQQPTTEEGGILKRKWWQRWTDDDAPECQHVVLSIDGAYSAKTSADFSAATIWGYFRKKVDGDIDRRPAADSLILLNAWKGRVEYPDFRARVLELIREHQPDTILIEDKASGQSLIQELRRAGIAVVAYQPDRDKVARAYAASNMIESGCVWVPERPWAGMVIDECAAFPTGANDDLVDTVTQALLRFRQSGMLRLQSDDTWDVPPPAMPRKPGSSYYA
jgi:predicted phage terminase large subunit-like protein